jgi:hypothetical protein
MKVKLFEIKGIEDGLKKVAETDLDVKVAYRIAKLLKKIAEESVVIEETRSKLVTKYGTYVQKEGQPVCEVDEDKKKDFFKEYGELLNQEIEIDIKTILLSDLEGIKLSPVDMIRLEKVIEEEKCCCDKKEECEKKEEVKVEEPVAPEVEDIGESDVVEPEEKKIVQKKKKEKNK